MRANATDRTAADAAPRCSSLTITCLNEKRPCPTNPRRRGRNRGTSCNMFEFLAELLSQQAALHRRPLPVQYPEQHDSHDQHVRAITHYHVTQTHQKTAYIQRISAQRKRPRGHQARQLGQIPRRPHANRLPDRHQGQPRPERRRASAWPQSAAQSTAPAAGTSVF